MTVATIVSAQVAKRQPFCSSDISVFDAAVEIADLGVNALAVVDNGALVGIITDHDIIRALADTGSEFSKQKVANWMTRKVITCAITEKLPWALSLLARHRIRHLVITDAGKPVAVLGSKEILTRIHEDDEIELRVLRDLARVSQASQVA